MRRSFLPGLGVAVAVIVVTLAAIRLLPATPAPPPTAATSTSAHGWVLPRLEGSGTVSLAQFRGHPTVVVLFASWCSACRDELPVVRQTSAALGDRVTFVGVDSEESGDGLAMARQFGIDSWPLARDIGGANVSGLHDSLGVVGMPGTAFYDSRGSLVDVHIGGMTKADLDAELTRLYGITPPA